MTRLSILTSLTRHRISSSAPDDPRVRKEWTLELRRQLRECDAKLARDRAMLASLRIITRSLALADPDIKAVAYTELGINVTYHADGRALLESRPRIDGVAGGVGGTRGPDSRRVALSAELALMTARIQAVASAQSEKTSDSRP